MYLLVTSRSAESLSLRRALAERSVLTQTATVHEILSPRYRISPFTVGCILPDSITGDGAAALRRRYPHLPIINCSLQKGTDVGPTRADYFLPNLAKDRLLSEILLCASDFHGRDVARLMHGPLQDHLLAPYSTLCGAPLLLPPCERRLLRYLLYAHPRPVTLKELSNFCGSPDGRLSPESVLRHLSHINSHSPYPLVAPLKGATFQLALKERMLNHE